MNKIFRAGMVTVSLIFLLISILPPTLALVVDSVIVDSNNLKPGQTTNVEIGLKNDGDSVLEDISVSLDLANVPFAPTGSSSEFSIDEIQKGKTKYGRFKVIVLNTAQPDIYKIPLKITYREEDQVEPQPIVRNSLISLSVTSEPSISINLEESFAIKNQANELTLKIINKGLGNIKFLEIELKNNPYVTLLTQNNIYIGDLDSNDFDTITFKLFVKTNAPDKITFPVTVRYKDALNEEYSEEGSVSFTAYTPEEAITLGLIDKSYTFEIMTVVILLIVFYLLYRYVRRSLRKRTVIGENF